MKKIVFQFLLFVLAINYLNAQVGINSDTANATLHIKGIKDSTYFRIEDKNNAEIMRIDKLGKLGIHTSTPTRSFDDNGTLRLEGITVPWIVASTQADTINYRQILAANATGDIEHISYDYFIHSVPIIKMVKYTSHASFITGSNDSTKLNSVTSIGILRIRYNTNNNGFKCVEFQCTEDNEFTLYGEKSGDGGRIGGSWAGYRYAKNPDGQKLKGYPQLDNTDGAWYPFQYNTSTANQYITDDFWYDAFDMMTTILMFKDSNKIYRVTTLAYDELKANESLGLKAEPAAIVFFIEELE